MNALQKKRLFLLDMDGTLYLGDRLFDGTAEFLDWTRRTGRRYIFLTNNSSKGVTDYVRKLARLGIEANANDFLTSVQVTVQYLQTRYAGKKLYVLGTQSFFTELSLHGLIVTDRPEGDVACLVMGFDTELTFGKLDDACRLLKAGVDYIATNPDLVCPTEFGFVPDCGSVAQMLRNATGRVPLFLGKPEARIVEMAMEAGGYSDSDTLVIGDRLSTDIACGINAGVDTALLLSGEAKRGDLAQTPYPPTWVFENIRECFDALSEEAAV